MILLRKTTNRNHLTLRKVAELISKYKKYLRVKRSMIERLAYRIMNRYRPAKLTKFMNKIDVHQRARKKKHPEGQQVHIYKKSKLN